MRKRLAIVGHSEEGLSLIPLLEANPDVEISAIVSDDPERARSGLAAVEPGLDRRFEEQLTSDAERVLRTPGLVALIDADAPDDLRGMLREAPERGVQVTTPLIAKLLYAFGPVDASRKPDLLHTLSEVLEGYNLTVDRRGLLSRILQIAVGSTGADRGSLMLYDPDAGCLVVEVAIGIESELIPKIRVTPGDGIAGLAFERGEAIVLQGKADREHYQVVRERDDVQSAIAAPLVFEDQVLGVLNLSHGRRSGAFDEEDVQFVEQLAALDAKIIARAEEYHALLRDSARLKAQAAVSEILGSSEPLSRRLSEVCTLVASEFSQAICHLFLYDDDVEQLIMHSSSVPLDPLSVPIRLDGESGIHGFVMRGREPVVLTQRVQGPGACYAVLPLIARGELLGVLSIEGMLARQVSDLVCEKIESLAEALSGEMSDVMRESRMEREAMRMTAITEAAGMMNRSSELSDLQRRITSSAAMILDAEHAVLRLQDQETGQYQIRSYFGSTELDAQSELFALEKEISIEAIRQRQSARMVDLSSRADLDAEALGVVSALVEVLQHDNRVIGSLSLLGKVARDPLAGEHFSREDEISLGRFAEQAQHALVQMTARDRSRSQRRFDDVTGLPNDVHLTERLEQEIARASGTSRSLALVRLQIVGLTQVLADQSQADADHMVQSVGQELRDALRDFDVLARIADDSFGILLPEPDQEVSSLMGPLARRALEVLRRQLEPRVIDRLKLEFGYASYPEDGASARLLLERVREPRIVGG